MGWRLREGFAEDKDVQRRTPACATDESRLCRLGWDGEFAMIGLVLGRAPF
jgi:hypothetical protein